jgi:hypothetical protein
MHYNTTDYNQTLTKKRRMSKGLVVTLAVLALSIVWLGVEIYLTNRSWSPIYGTTRHSIGDRLALGLIIISLGVLIIYGLKLATRQNIIWVIVFMTLFVISPNYVIVTTYAGELGMYSKWQWFGGVTPMFGIGAVFSVPLLILGIGIILIIITKVRQRRHQIGEQTTQKPPIEPPIISTPI